MKTLVSLASTEARTQLPVLGRPSPSLLSQLAEAGKEEAGSVSTVEMLMRLSWRGVSLFSRAPPVFLLS